MTNRVLPLLHLLPATDTEYLCVPGFLSSSLYFSLFWKWNERIFKHISASKNASSKIWIQGIKPIAMSLSKLEKDRLWVVDLFCNKRGLKSLPYYVLSANKASPGFMLTLKRLNSLSCKILNTLSSCVRKLTKLFWFTAYFSIHLTVLQTGKIQPWLPARHNMKNSIIIRLVMAFKSKFIIMHRNHLTSPTVSSTTRTVTLSDYNSGFIMFKPLPSKDSLDKKIFFYS